VIRAWDVPGIDHADLQARSAKYTEQNNVHLLDETLINDNNRLFVVGGRNAGYYVEQFPVNVKGCRGSSLCNLGCPNQAKQGTNRVQLPRAERAGVEVVTRAEVQRITSDRTLDVRVSERSPGAKGAPSEWAPGDYRVQAHIVVVAGGAIGTTSLLLRSALPAPRSLGHGFTCHPALILVAEHPGPITNDVGHPKSYFVDHAESERFVLETCMYFPFVTAKSLTGFGATHSEIMRAFPRLQMILLLACDHATPDNRIAVIGPGVPSSTIASLPRPSTDWCAAPARQRGSSSPPAPGACMRPPTRRSSRPPTLDGSTSASPPVTSGPVRSPFRRPT